MTRCTGHDHLERQCTFEYGHFGACSIHRPHCAIVSAARELSLDYGCSGTREGDLLSTAFERFADLIERNQ